MPIYEYQCASCSHRVEMIQKFSDAPLTDCPSCGRAELQKLISAPAFRLKGGGWYETDFKNGTKRNVAESESKSDPGPPACGAGACSSCAD
jgi:putative FmdB family regulatory protein